MKQIGIIGAGAVGAYFIWGMKDIDDMCVTLIADGERKERLKAGVSINQEIYVTDVKAPEEKSDYDVIFVCTKYAGLDSAIELLKATAGENTIILSLLNGVDSEEKIRAAGVKGTILPSVMRIASKRDAQGTIFNPDVTQGVFFGTSRRCEANEKEAVETLSKILDKTKVNYTIQEDMETDMWVKYGANISNNLPQAVLGTDASIYFDSEHGYFLASKLWNEVRLVAETKGIILSKEPLIFPCAKTSKYSTLQDIECGRHTEIDMFAGCLIDMAKEAGIEVPYAEYTYHAIKILEEKMDGLVGK